MNTRKKECSCLTRKKKELNCPENKANSIITCQLTFLRMVGGNASNSSFVMAGNDVVELDGDGASVPLPEPWDSWLRTWC